MKNANWYQTGEARIVPWYFGLMRAELRWQRDYSDADGEVMPYSVQWRPAGRLPFKYDNIGPFGFWSTMSAQPMHGERFIWKRFISYWNKPAPPADEGT